MNQVIFVQREVSTMEKISERSHFYAANIVVDQLHLFRLSGNIWWNLSKSATLR